jgi:hypothetical protein
MAKRKSHGEASASAGRSQSARSKEQWLARLLSVMAEELELAQAKM